MKQNFNQKKRKINKKQIKKSNPFDWLKQKRMYNGIRLECDARNNWVKTTKIINMSLQRQQNLNVQDKIDEEPI